MKVFSYEIVDRMGRPGKGQMAAADEMIVAERLRNMGLTVLDVNEIRRHSLRNIFKRKPKVGLGELAIFSRQLHTLLEAGIPLTRGLITLSSQVPNRGFSEILEEVAQHVDSGMSFSDALNSYPQVFPEIFVNMVRSGEASGSLDEILKQLSEQMDREKILRDQIKAATFYPILVLIFALVIVIGMLVGVVPVFVRFFPEGLPLPLATRMIMAFSDSLRGFWYLYLLVGMALIYGLRHYLATPSGSRNWDRVRFKLPAFGPFIYRIVMARFARVLATLLTGGIPVVQALETAGPASGSIRVADAVKTASEKIHEGQNLADPMAESGVFSPMMVQMVGVGEESGNLSDMLCRVSVFYEEEVAALSKTLASIVEPLLFVFVGVIVGFIVIAMYLPIFHVVTTVGG